MAYRRQSGHMNIMDSQESERTSMGENDGLIRLNVGGTWYTTTSATLRSQTNTLFTKMLDKGPKHNATKDDKGYYFIDRDGQLFRHVLNYLRSSELNLPTDFKEYDQLMDEAKFYSIPSLIKALERAKNPTDRAYIEIIETAHPEKIGVCSARVVITEELQERSPIYEMIEGLQGSREVYHGAFGRFWMRTNMTRLDWAEKLTSYGWVLAGTTSVCRRLPDITGTGTDLCHIIEKWCTK